MNEHKSKLDWKVWKEWCGNHEDYTIREFIRAMKNNSQYFSAMPKHFQDLMNAIPHSELQTLSIGALWNPMYDSTRILPGNVYSLIPGWQHPEKQPWENFEKQCKAYDYSPNTIINSCKENVTPYIYIDIDDDTNIKHDWLVKNLFQIVPYHELIFLTLYGEWEPNDAQYKPEKHPGITYRLPYDWQLSNSTVYSNNKSNEK